MLDSWRKGGVHAQLLLGGLASELFSSNPDGDGGPEFWCFSSTHLKARPQGQGVTDHE